nr:hypothetical protein [Brucella anthropi]
MTRSEVLTPVADIATDAFCIVNRIGCAVHSMPWSEIAIWMPVALAVAFVASLVCDCLFDGLFWIAEKVFDKKGGVQ